MILNRMVDMDPMDFKKEFVYRVAVKCPEIVMAVDQELINQCMSYNETPEISADLVIVGTALMFAAVMLRENGKDISSKYSDIPVRDISKQFINLLPTGEQISLSELVLKIYEILNKEEK